MTRTWCPGYCTGCVLGRLLLPGSDVRLSLTAVENLTDACLAAVDWPPGAYNIADPVPYRRDEAIRTVLRAHCVRAKVGHLPLPVARTAAATAEALSRLRLSQRAVADPLRRRPAGPQCRPRRDEGPATGLDGAPHPDRLRASGLRTVTGGCPSLGRGSIRPYPEGFAAG
ncbi:hypothetical protein GCM10020000_81550 [Streptomyces olivoverticillatus]